MRACGCTLKQVVCPLGERCRKGEEVEITVPVSVFPWVFEISLRQQVGGKNQSD